MSTFAASTCSFTACQTSLRETAVRRGSTASIRPVSGSTATQSPTAGRPPSRASRDDRARAHLAALADQVVGAAMLNGDAGRREPRGAMNFERGFPAVVPTE